MQQQRYQFCGGTQWQWVSPLANALRVSLQKVCRHILLLTSSGCHLQQLVHLAIFRTAAIEQMQRLMVHNC